MLKTCVKLPKTSFIHSVTKEEYDTCQITHPHPRVIARCDKPQELMYFTITFRPFTPNPGGMEFKPGKDYYFISTSAPEDLHRRSGGHCATHNMKVAFKVADNTSRERQPTAVNVPRSKGRRLRPHPPPALGPADHNWSEDRLRYSVDTNYDDVIYDVTSNEINRPNDLTDQRLVAEAAAATGQSSSASSVAKIPSLLLALVTLLVLREML